MGSTLLLLICELLGNRLLYIVRRSWSSLGAKARTRRGPEKGTGAENMAQDENSTYAADGEGNDSGADARDRTHASGISRIGSLYIKGRVGPILRGWARPLMPTSKTPLLFLAYRLRKWTLSPLNSPRLFLP